MFLIHLNCSNIYLTVLLFLCFTEALEILIHFLKIINIRQDYCNCKSAKLIHTKTEIILFERDYLKSVKC